MSKLRSKLMLASLAAVFAVYAQAPTGIISGTVTDESGAVIPNATITIKNKATGFARTVTTSPLGLYRAPALPAGEYVVQAEVTGFRTLLLHATVQTGESTTINLHIQLDTTNYLHALNVTPP